MSKHESGVLLQASIPESYDFLMHQGRSSDLLLLLHLPIRQLANSGLQFSKRKLTEFTASGNVQDLHLIPFSFRQVETLSKTKLAEKPKAYFYLTEKLLTGLSANKKKEAK
jgi:hypothetical protein